MAWTLRGVLEGGASGTPGTTGVTTTDNGGVQSGDLLVAVMETDQGGATWTQLSGWTKAEEQTVSASVALQWKIAGGSEPSTYTFVNNDGNNADIGLRGAVFSPNGATISVDDTSILIDSDSDRVHDTSSVTVVAGVDSVGLLVVWFTSRDSLGITTAPASVTIIDELLNTDTTPDVGSTSIVGYYNLTQAAGAVTKQIQWDTNNQHKVAVALAASLAASGTVYELSPTVSATCATTATLYKVTEVDFGGVDAVSAASIAGVQVVKSMAATVGGASTATVTVATIAQLSATVGATASASVTEGTVYALAASVDATSAASSPTSVFIYRDAQADGVSSVSVSMSARYALAASVDGLSETSLALTQVYGVAVVQGAYAAEHARAYREVGRAGGS